jgi:predicted ArsR family transcriptional regulator
MEVGPEGKTPTNQEDQMTTTPTTPTEAITAALAAHLEASAAELAEAAGIGGSTASKCLASLERDGIAVRRPGGHEGGRRVADRWALAANTGSTEPSAEDVPPATDESSASRLHKGELSTLVLDYLKAHAEKAIGPVRSARRSADLRAQSRTRASASRRQAASVSRAPRRVATRSPKRDRQPVPYRPAPP